MAVKEKVESIPTEVKEEVLRDYRVANVSRNASLIGRKEVLTGKAKFGIFGDGKEIPQLAMAKAFQFGDFRAGYYRDQTFMFATENLNLEEWFAQLYAHASLEKDPSSAGRQMGGHYSTRSLNEDGSWKDLTKIKNSTADISPTASQMPRSLGLALASKHFRQDEQLHAYTNFTDKGNEVAFATIGDASTSEGHFWETLNAAAVQRVPLVVNVWDDGYGISVPKKYQTTKASVSEALAGFAYDEEKGGIHIYNVKGWDYPALVATYEEAVAKTRETHIPALIHVEEVTQPQGHSTSGSHERYKSKDRLTFEKEFDGIVKMREWMIASGIASAEECDAIEKEAKDEASQAKRNAWSSFASEIKAEIQEVCAIMDQIAAESAQAQEVVVAKETLLSTLDPLRKDTFVAIREVLRATRFESSNAIEQLRTWKRNNDEINLDRYKSHLYSQSNESALMIPEVPASFDDDAESIPGFNILNQCFDNHLTTNPLVCAFGEDVGKIGDVNQAFAGLQEKHGEIRVFDTGIREATIMGQAIGMAMRGIRPIAEIQYLDYLLYGLQQLSDDLATLQYRTKGGQKAPAIIRTRGHRLEGIWHTGSPMGMVLSTLRGMYVCVPRNMVQAAGMYNTLLKSDDAAIVVECLNGYRLREKCPTNLNEFTVPLGQVETLTQGDDVTLVTYGSNVRVAQQAIAKLEGLGISVELIDVQTLIPFDLTHQIVDSVKKTNRLVVLDEDVPGGASAFILAKILEEQNAYQFLDSKPVTIAAAENRGAYGSDGDYFTKPSADDIIDVIYEMMNEVEPQNYPLFN